jgi:Protein of unknown function (DUF2868)
MKLPSRKKHEKSAPETLSTAQGSPAEGTSDRTFRKEKWGIRDLIDLEYFLHGDEEKDEEDLIRRDRAIFLEIVSPGQKRLPSRRSLVRGWLEARKKEEQVPVLPGTAFYETMALLKWIGFVLGILSGGGLALTLLHYQGVQPVNVSGYVGLLIVLQAFLLFLLGVGFFLRHFVRFFRRKTLLATFWGALLYGLAKRMTASGMERLDGNRRSRLQATLGLLKSRRSVYGSLFFLPIFMVSQIFGLAFNLGALVATLSRVLTSDLAFGWQTTVQVGPEVVYKLVQVLALPWAWLAPEGTGFPTLVQIENSRIILKEGIAHLATPDLVSWWPFLCLGIVFYGVLPRLVFCLGSWAARRIALARLDFSHAACDSIIRRMQTPLLETTHPDMETEQDESASPEASSEATTLFQTGSNLGIALMNEELAARSSRTDIFRAGETYFGMSISETLEIGGQLDRDQEVLERLKTTDWAGKQSGVLLIQEAWQPPILESLAFLRQLRMALPEKGKIAVLLIGKPSSETVFTPPGKIDRKVWEEQLQALGDPYLGVACPRKGI